MRTLYFDSALLPQGWMDDVALTINQNGNIEDVMVKTATPDHVQSAGCVLPGIPNLHSHAHQRAMAGLAEYAGENTDSFWSWRDVMYQYVNRITPQQLESVAAQLYVEMLKSGYTTVAEFQYVHHDPDGSPYTRRAEMSLRTCAAARSAGIAMTCLPVLYSFSDFGSGRPHAAQSRFINDAGGYLNIVFAIADDVQDEPNLSFGVAPHSLRAINRALLAEVLDNTGGDNFPIHIHIAEQSKEVDGCLAWSGKRPVEWLLANFDVNHRWCLVHATHMNEAETVQLAKTGAVVGLCPTTEANLGDGFFNMKQFLPSQGKFGIGSDSHISVNPVEELRWLEYGQRLLQQARNVLVSDEHISTGRFLFEHAVAGGAQACARHTGRIEAGYRADLIVIDTEHPLLYQRRGDALLDSWIFSGNASAVRDVYVGGHQLVKNRIHIHEQQILDNFKQTIDQLQH